MTATILFLIHWLVFVWMGTIILWVVMFLASYWPNIVAAVFGLGAGLLLGYLIVFNMGGFQ